MTTALYVIWILIPAAFFVMALWSKLEGMSDKERGQRRKNEAADLSKQGLFITACVAFSFLMDMYFLEDLVTPFLPDMIPLNLVRVFLLPIVLWIGAMLIGGRKPVRIERPGIRNRRRPGQKK